MCYHVSVNVPVGDIVEVFGDLIVEPGLRDDFLPSPYINGFDHKMQPVMLRSRKDAQRHLAAMMWGFLPGWVKNFDEATKLWNGSYDANGKFRPGIITLNAIGEEMLEKPMYKDAALNRRCIVFADGFFEWHHHYPLGKKGQRLKTAIKYPHHITLKDNPQPFMMLAGIWQPWKHTEVNAETGEVVEAVTPTFAVVTTAANELMGNIHNSKKRMPVILTKELAAEWIQDDLSTDRIKSIAAFQYPSEKMEAYTVAKDFQEVADPKKPHVYEEWDGVFC